MGSFLEHSRIYRFGGAPADPAAGPGLPLKIYIGSADLMGRNLDRRIEVVVPVHDPELQARLFEVLDLVFADETNAWELGPDRRWRRVPNRHGLSSRSGSRSWHGSGPVAVSNRTSASERVSRRSQLGSRTTARRYHPAPWRGIRLALRMQAISSTRGWAWPVLSGVCAGIGVTILALVHQQLDLGTYLLGGAHARSNDLFSVTYPTDHLGFTYPPFSALLFAPFAHVPPRVCEVVFSWVNLVALCALVAVSLRAVCAALDRRTVVWWALALLLPVLLFDPVRQTFLLGQVNIILALMVVADMTLDLPAAPGDPGRVGGCHQGDADHPRPLSAPDQAGSLRARTVGSFCAAALVAAASTPRRRGPTGRTTSAPRNGPACSRGSATRDCSARSSGCWATP